MGGVVRSPCDATASQVRLIIERQRQGGSYWARWTADACKEQLLAHLPASVDEWTELNLVLAGGMSCNATASGLDCTARTTAAHFDALRIASSTEATPMPPMMPPLLPSPAPGVPPPSPLPPKVPAAVPTGASAAASLEYAFLFAGALMPPAILFFAMGARWLRLHGHRWRRLKAPMGCPCYPDPSGPLERRFEGTDGHAVPMGASSDRARLMDADQTPDACAYSGRSAHGDLNSSESRSAAAELPAGGDDPRGELHEQGASRRPWPSEDVLDALRDGLAHPTAHPTAPPPPTSSSWCRCESRCEEPPPPRETLVHFSLHSTAGMLPEASTALPLRGHGAAGAPTTFADLVHLLADVGSEVLRTRLCAEQLRVEYAVKGGTGRDRKRLVATSLTAMSSLLDAEALYVRCCAPKAAESAARSTREWPPLLHDGKLACGPEALSDPPTDAMPLAPLPPPPPLPPPLMPPPPSTPPTLQPRLSAPPAPDQGPSGQPHDTSSVSPTPRAPLLPPASLVAEADAWAGAMLRPPSPLVATDHMLRPPPPLVARVAKQNPALQWLASAQQHLSDAHALVPLRPPIMYCEATLALTHIFCSVPSFTPPLLWTQAWGTWWRNNASVRLRTVATRLSMASLENTFDILRVAGLLTNQPAAVRVL